MSEIKFNGVKIGEGPVDYKVYRGTVGGEVAEITPGIEITPVEFTVTRVVPGPAMAGIAAALEIDLFDGTSTIDPKAVASELKHLRARIETLESKDVSAHNVVEMIDTMSKTFEKERHSVKGRIMRCMPPGAGPLITGVVEGVSQEIYASNERMIEYLGMMKKMFDKSDAVSPASRAQQEWMQRKISDEIKAAMKSVHGKIDRLDGEARSAFMSELEAL